MEATFLTATSLDSLALRPLPPLHAYQPGATHTECGISLDGLQRLDLPFAGAGESCRDCIVVMSN